MQLQRPTAPTPPPDLATGLAARRDASGQRPAITQLSGAGRAEQGFVTLAQWAAKGAHLLQTDAYVAPGDRVHVDVPPSWPLAAVCCAVWWIGGTVVVGEARDVVASIRHQSRPGGDAELRWVVGDAVDGGVTGPDEDPEWAQEVQVFPDNPPAALARPDLTALVTPEGTWTHAELIASLADDRGPLGIDTSTFLGDAVREVAARPLVTGRTSLVLTDLDREAAAGDRITIWA